MMYNNLLRLITSRGTISWLCSIMRCQMYFTFILFIDTTITYWVYFFIVKVVKTLAGYLQTHELQFLNQMLHFHNQLIPGSSITLLLPSYNNLEEPFFLPFLTSMSRSWGLGCKFLLFISPTKANFKVYVINTRLSCDQNNQGVGS